MTDENKDIVVITFMLVIDIIALMFVLSGVLPLNKVTMIAIGVMTALSFILVIRFTMDKF